MKYYSYSNKMFTRRVKPIRIIGDPGNWNSAVCAVVFVLTRHIGLLYCTSARVFQKFGNRLQVLGAGRMACRRFHIEGPQILGVAVNNLVARRSGTCAVL
jgi:hypothetical protein